MNGVDVAILVVLAVLLIKGLWLGLIHEVCSLVGLAAGTALAVRYHATLAGMLPAWSKLPPWLLAAACFAVLFLACLFCFVVIGILLSRFFRLIFLGGLNRVLGGLFGIAQGVLLLALVLYGLSQGNWFKDARQASRLAPPFVVLGEQLVNGGRQLLQ